MGRCETACVPSTNPRREHVCVRCARVIETRERDRELEAELFTLAAELNERAHGEHPGSFASRVFDRLEMGQQRYGDEYLHRDNLTEAAEETPDAAAYVLLELHRLRPTVDEDDWQELRMAALAAMSAAIHCDVALMRMVRLRAEVTT
jgi:transcription initiation factor TFIIIB Brf1 subunit/transcription initiation factor TFIIB